MQVNGLHTDITVASIPIFIGIAKLLEFFGSHLADISYIVGIIAGAITIYYKLKNKQ